MQEHGSVVWEHGLCGLMTGLRCASDRELMQKADWSMYNLTSWWPGPLCRGLWRRYDINDNPIVDRKRDVEPLAPIGMGFWGCQCTRSGSWCSRPLQDPVSRDREVLLRGASRGGCNV